MDGCFLTNDLQLDLQAFSETRKYVSYLMLHLHSFCGLVSALMHSNVVEDRG